MLAVVACGVPQNSIEVKTAREAAAANCDETGKCVKDPSGLVLYNSNLVTENFVLKRPDANQTLLTTLMNLIDEPKLLVASERLEPLMRGVAIVREFEPCDSPKGIDGSNPTAGQLRSLKQGRYKACITYIGDGLFKRAYSLAPIDVDTTPPDVAKIVVTHTAVTPSTASLSWSKASDNLTADAKLVYSVYTSKTNALDSLQAVLTYGNQSPAFLTSGTSYIIESLSESTAYHAAVVVTDEAGNQSFVGRTYFSTPASYTTPPSFPSVVINGGSAFTNGTSTSLTLSAGGASEMYVSNSAGCASGSSWEAYVTTKPWTLVQTNDVAIVYAKFRDAAGNETSCVSDTIIHDNTAPLIPVISEASKSFNAVFITSIQQNLVPDSNFKEFRYTLNGTDPTCSTGTASASQPTSVMIPASTTTLKAISCDQLGLSSLVASATYSHDDTAPTVMITTTSSLATNVSPIPITITFSKAVTGFDVNEITVGNGTAGSFVGSGATYQVSITPTAQGAVTVDVGANVAQDVVGNNNLAAERLSLTYDSTPPASPRVFVNNGAAFTANSAATLTLSADDASEMYVSNVAGCASGGSWEVYGTSKSWTLGQMNGTASVYAKFRDAVGNETACVSDTIIHDNTSPVMPLISEAGKFFNASFSTTIQQGAPTDANFKEFRYTTTGEDPTCLSGTTSSNEPAGVMILPVTTTLKVVACDQVGQASPVASVTYTYDNTAPTVSLATTAPGITKVSPIPVTITFSKVVTGFDVGDISVANGSAVGFAGSGNTYSASIIPSSQGLVTVNVLAGVVRDVALNDNLAAESPLSFTYDTLPPGITDASVTTPSPGISLTPSVAFTSDEAGTFVLSSATDCSSGLISASGSLVAGTNTVTTNALTSDSLTAIRVKATDLVGNTSCTEVGSYENDMTRPEAPVIDPSRLFNAAFFASIQQGPAVDVNFKDFRYTLTGIAPSCSSGTATTGGLEIIPITTQTTTFKVVACDLAGNASDPAVSIYTYDSVRPNVILSSSLASVTRDNPTIITINFSKAVTDFVVGDIQVTNASLSDFSGSDLNYSVKVSPTNDGQVTILVPGDVAQDNLGNTNTGSNTIIYTYDTTPPSSPGLVINSNAVYTATTGVTLTLSAGEASQMYVSNTSGCASGGSWEAYSTSKSWTLGQTDATATVYVKYRDAVGNETACVNDTIIHDSTAPVQPIILDPARSFNTSFTTTISQGASVDANFKEFRYTTSGTDPTCSTGTASAAQPTSVTIPAATTKLKAISCDQVGLGSSVVTSTYTFDAVVPTVTLTSSIDSNTNVSPIPVTIVFSESVTGFLDDDITVSNGTKSGFSGSGSTYTVNVSPSEQGAVTINVASGAAQDAAGNSNTAATQLSRTFDSVAPSFSAVSVQSTSPSTTNFTPTVAFTLSEAATVTLFSDTCTTSISFATSLASGARTMNTNTLPDSAVTTIYARGVDSTGNTSSCTLIGSYTTQLPAPTLSTPIVYSSSLGLSWSSISGATSYNLYWSTSSGVTTSSNVLQGVTSIYNHTGRLLQVPYYYRVAAIKNSVVGVLSSEVSGSPDVVPNAPSISTLTAGNSQVGIGWGAPVANGGSIILDYIVEYSSNGGSSWVLFSDGNSSATSTTVTGLLNGTAYIFRVAAVNTAGAGGFSSNSSSVVPVLPCSNNVAVTRLNDCYNEGSSPNYAQDLPIGTERGGPGGVRISLQFANGVSGYKVWKEVSGSRVLNATGLVANGWQEQLTRAGTAFNGANFTSTADISGRVCPTHVFLSHASMITTGRCLYFDGGNSARDLHAAAGTEAEDWLTGWDRAATGRGTASSYYEGNIKVCADKGMRLPTMYETRMTKPSSYLPTGDGGINPSYAGSVEGVPSFTGFTWTASGRNWSIYADNGYFSWSGTTLDRRVYNEASYVRCVLP